MSKKTAIIIIQDELIPPFQEPARDILIQNEKLSKHQDEVLRRLGFVITRVTQAESSVALSKATNGSLLLHEHLFFSPEFLQEFLDKSQGKTTRASLKKGVYTRQLAVLQDVEERDEYLAYPLYHIASEKELEKADDIVIDVDEYFEEGSFPPHMLNKDNFKYSITTRPIVALTEPLHIGLANIAANFARIARLRKPGLWPGLKALWAGLTAFSIDKTTIKARALRALSLISPSAEVHPTAVVEGSIIGPKAKIGAYAVVRFSVVGEGAFVDDHAGLKFSTVGDGAYIANNNVLFFSTVYPRAFLISGPYQFCCFGYDTAIMNSIPTDYRLDGKTIKVKTKHGLQDTGLRFAGSIIGHGTRIAAGLIFGPGRAIPKELTLYPDPARVLTKIDENLADQGNVWFLKDGVLTDEPLKRKK